MDMTTRGLVVGATVVMLSTVTIIGAGIHMKGQAFFQDSPKELIDEVWQIINKNYVDATFNQVDWRAVRNDYLNRSYTSQEEAYDAIREMLEQLEDPYTRFMDPDEFRSMQIDTSGELTGVGIQLAQDEETNKLVVVSPIEDTPAFEAGIQSQDIIAEIDGRSTEGMDINEAVNLIRGPVGSEVVLTVLRNDREIEFPITRARIEIHPVRYSYREDLPGGVGYIRLTQFSQLATEEMRDAIRELEDRGVEAYVLDLRANPGGLLQASIEIARMWLDEGKIVSTVDRQGISEVQRANGRALTDKPLVVLVDGGSASASEILSGALQDNDRAVLVGTQTFGKGLVQSVRPVGNGSGLAVTIAKYFTPNGRDINQEGIPPDIESELSEESREALRTDRTLIGTLQDPQYSQAIEVLQSASIATQSPE
ncbi:carboxyl-terminal processing protease CtpC [Baaleninema simplex]|uniref:carboxyl-terminal processing protease CtpC n=1 Tax=Baaleninema simplex TaxID=2862350 RepID=UPI00316ABE33